MTRAYFVRHAQPNVNNHDDITRELSEKVLPRDVGAGNFSLEPDAFRSAKRDYMCRAGRGKFQI